VRWNSVGLQATGQVNSWIVGGHCHVGQVLPEIVGQQDCSQVLPDIVGQHCGQVEPESVPTAQPVAKHVLPVTVT
jgi:S-ribosylhomocysteine lyase LuxS involved in autoinducer biosynthesis